MGGGSVPVTPANFAAALIATNNGDTLELDNGTYTGTWQVNTQNLTIKNKAGAHPIVDGGFVLNASGITIQGLEILNSSWSDRTTATGIPFGVEVTASAPNAKVRNCMIHDTNTGVIVAANGAEITGNLFWNIGATAYEHDIYTNNDVTVSNIRDNILGATYSGWGLQAYSEVGGRVNNIHAIGNVALWEKYIIFAVGVITSGVQFQNNEGYKTLALIGQAAQDNLDVSITGNYLVYSRDDGVLLDVRRWTTPTVTGNTLIGDANDGLINFVPCAGPGPTWNGNTYVMQNATATKFVNDNATPENFTDWKASHSGLDTTSTLSASLPTTNRVVIRQNPVDAERAWIVVYNWENSANISLDLSSLSLVNGRQYILRQAQDPKGDTQTFTYDGSAVTVSMSGHTVATPTAAGSPIVSSTFPAFGCWLLEKA